MVAAFVRDLTSRVRRVGDDPLGAALVAVAPPLRALAPPSRAGCIIAQAPESLSKVYRRAEFWDPERRPSATS